MAENFEDMVRRVDTRRDEAVEHANQANRQRAANTQRVADEVREGIRDLVDFVDKRRPAKQYECGSKQRFRRCQSPQGFLMLGPANLAILTTDGLVWRCGYDTYSKKHKHTMIDVAEEVAKGHNITFGALTFSMGSDGELVAHEHMGRDVIPREWLFRPYLAEVAAKLAQGQTVDAVS